MTDARDKCKQERREGRIVEEMERGIHGNEETLEDICGLPVCTHQSYSMYDLCEIPC